MDNEYLLTRLGWPVGCYVNKNGEVPRFCVVPVFSCESVAKAMAWYLNNKCEVYKGLDIVPTCQYDGGVEEIRFAVVRHTEDAYTDEQTIWGHSAVWMMPRALWTIRELRSRSHQSI